MNPQVAETGSERLDVRARRAEQPLRQLDRARGGVLEPALQHVDQGAVFLAIVDRVEPEHGGLLLRVTVGEADMEPLCAGRGAAAHDQPGGRSSVTVREGLLDVLPHLPEPDEIRVRVEDDDAKRRLEQKLLEDRAERVGLPRPRLAAEERVPVEAARVEGEAHTRLEHELADVERGPLRSRALQPGHDRGLVCRLDRKVVERRTAVFEDDAVAAGKGNPNVGRTGELRAHNRGKLSSLGRRELDCVDLTQPSADRDVAAGLQLEPVNRALECETPAVYGGGRRDDGGLEIAATRVGHRGRDYPGLLLGHDINCHQQGPGWLRRSHLGPSPTSRQDRAPRRGRRSPRSR